MAAAHILVLTDRDWTHPQGGGTGTNLYGQVARWVAWGHRVTVVAGTYPGAEAREELAPNLDRAPDGHAADGLPARGAGRAAARARARRRRRARGRQRDRLPDAAVAARAARGARAPRPPRPLRRRAGPPGARVAALLAETLPLRLLYRDTPFLTISEAGRRDLVELGCPPTASTSPTSASSRRRSTAGERAAEPRLLYLGRLKQYKRVELLLDVLEAIPDAVLDIAGEGDHRPALEAEIAAPRARRPRRAARPRQRGRKAELLSRAGST